MSNLPSADTIAGRLAALRASMPEGVELVAVSKFHPLESLREAYGAGQRVFGESRANELRAKAVEMLLKNCNSSSLLLKRLISFIMDFVNRTSPAKLTFPFVSSGACLISSSASA